MTIVPVPKKDGSVRICGDYKGTVNPELQAEQYSLPRIEDTCIFAKLSGGQKFSKIDLRHAYHQLEKKIPRNTTPSTHTWVCFSTTD